MFTANSVLEFTDSSAFPATGDTRKLYLDLSNGKLSRWANSAYVVVSEVEELRPWDLPLITLEPVQVSDFLGLIDQAREASKNRTDVQERPVHLLPLKEMIELPHGTGYYKRAVAEGEETSLSDMVHSWLLYFGVQVGNFQMLSIIDLPEYRATFVRARLNENSQWGSWYMYTSGYPIPMDRSVLVTEIFSHA